MAADYLIVYITTNPSPTIKIDIPRIALPVTVDDKKATAISIRIRLQIK